MLAPFWKSGSDAMLYCLWFVIYNSLAPCCSSARETRPIYLTHKTKGTRPKSCDSLALWSLDLTMRPWFAGGYWASESHDLGRVPGGTGPIYLTHMKHTSRTHGPSHDTSHPVVAVDDALLVCRDIPVKTDLVFVKQCLEAHVLLPIVIYIYLYITSCSPLYVP